MEQKQCFWLILVPLLRSACWRLAHALQHLKPTSARQPLSSFPHLHQHQAIHKSTLEQVGVALHWKACT